MIQIDDKQYEVVIKKKRCKNIILRVEDGILKVSCPYYVSKEEALEFVKSRIDWIAKTEKKKHEGSLLGIGKTIYYLGKEYNLVILKGNKSFKIDEDTIYIRCRKQDVESATKVFYEHGKAILMGLILDRQDKYLKVIKDYGYMNEPDYYFKYMTSMWGSCYSRNNKININVRLIHFDPICLEAILWHELLHFIMPNHSKRFYQILEMYMPNYKQIIKTIK